MALRSLLEMVRNSGVHFSCKSLEVDSKRQIAFESPAIQRDFASYSKNHMCSTSSGR